MGHRHCNEESRKNKHLTYKDRLRIEVMLKEKKKSREIAEALERSQRTIQREIKRGQVKQFDGFRWLYFERYSADKGQQDYAYKRSGGGAKLKIGHDHKLCEEIERQIKCKRSPDVIAHDIKQRRDEFSRTLCARTIYRYLAQNIFLHVDYRDLVYGPYRKKRNERVNRPSYRNLKGRGIEERPAQANTRQEFGHWEMDLVLSGKGQGSSCLLTLTERRSRYEIIRKLPDKTQDSVIHALDVMERALRRKPFAACFKTITVDNGSEFLNSLAMERSCLVSGKQRTQVFYAHPYSAYERGSNENLNRMIRRFIPKGADIGSYTQKAIKRIEQWLNTYPRKILAYRTPQEILNMTT